jgi:hypothetical protein
MCLFAIVMALFWFHCSGFQKLEGIHKQQGDLLSPLLFFQNKESRLKNGSYRKRMEGCGLNSSSSEQGSVVGYCVHVMNFSISYYAGNLLIGPGTVYQILENNSAPWSKFAVSVIF